MPLRRGMETVVIQLREGKKKRAGKPCLAPCPFSTRPPKTHPHPLHLHSPQNSHALPNLRLSTDPNPYRTTLGASHPFNNHRTPSTKSSIKTKSSNHDITGPRPTTSRSTRCRSCTLWRATEAWPSACQPCLRDPLRTRKPLTRCTGCVRKPAPSWCCRRSCPPPPCPQRSLLTCPRTWCSCPRAR
jgi:hypothetical protein